MCSKKWKPVRTKADFVQRYRDGEFGNASPTWNSVNKWLSEGCKDLSDKERLFHLRNRVAAGDTYYNLPASEVVRLASEDLRDRIHEFYVSEMAPTHRTVIQGEVAEGPLGLWLTYTDVKKPMRDALAEKQLTATGLSAKVILDSYLSSDSLDWLYHLLHRYPGHVVEFSTYSKIWGTVPGYDTVYWEVRLY